MSPKYACLVEGRIALIVGGARGIGEGIARDFVKNGATVAIADVALERMQKLASELNKLSPKKALAVHCDVTNEQSVEDMVSKVVQSFGGIDVLVYSVGIVKSGSVKSLSLDDFESVVRVNMTGYFLCVKHVARVMAEQHKQEPSRIMDII